MTTAVLTNTITDPSGTAQSGIVVQAVLMPSAGFRANATEVARYETTTTDGSGIWSLTLERNDQITPSGTYWQITEKLPAPQGPSVWAVNLTTSSTLQAALASPLPAYDGLEYITQLAGDARYDRLSVFNVKSYGAVGDGVTNDSSAVASAYAAAAVLGGIVHFPYGTYLMNTGIACTSSKVAISGSGSGSTLIEYRGSGDCLRIKPTVFTAQQGVSISGLRIDGQGATGSACGIHAGDVVGLEFHDVVVYGFSDTGQKGVWFDNTTFWTERLLAIGLDVEYCDTCYLFTKNGGTNSFGYARLLDIRCTITAGQTGIRFEDDSLLYSSILNVICNVDGSTALDPSIFIDLADTSQIQNGSQVITGEQTAGTGAIGVRVAAGARFIGGNGSTVRLENFTTRFDVPVSRVPQMRFVQSGKAVDGTRQAPDAGDLAAFLGTVGIYEVLPTMVGDEVEPYGHAGFIQGTNVHSPYVCMYNANFNAFVVYRLDFGGDLNDMVPMFVFRNDGAMLFFNGISVRSGPGSPEGVVAAEVGSQFLRSDGGAGTSLYVKESGGGGNTGWTAK